jgi:hypothetical protein
VVWATATATGKKISMVKIVFIAASETTMCVQEKKGETEPEGVGFSLSC